MPPAINVAENPYYEEGIPLNDNQISLNENWILPDVIFFSNLNLIRLEA